MVTLNKQTTNLNNEDLKTLLRPLKRDGDHTIPSLKKDLLKYYELQKDREYLQHNVEGESDTVDNNV